MDTLYFRVNGDERQIVDNDGGLEHKLNTLYTYVYTKMIKKQSTMMREGRRKWTYSIHMHKQR